MLQCYVCNNKKIVKFTYKKRLNLAVFVINVIIIFGVYSTLRVRNLSFQSGDVVVVIVWKLDLQLPVQSVPFTTYVVSSHPVHGEVYSATLCDKVCQW
jgi:hypothetical protein